jgi:hypothetical protein
MGFPGIGEQDPRAASVSYHIEVQSHARNTIGVVCLHLDNVVAQVLPS